VAQEDFIDSVGNRKRLHGAGKKTSGRLKLDGEDALVHSLRKSTTYRDEEQ